jgi:hypothetical protein
MSRTPHRHRLTVQDEDVEHVRDGDAEERGHDERVGDLPLERYRAGRHDADAGNEDEHDREHRPEAPQQARQLLEDGRVFDVLLGRGPGLQKRRDGRWQSVTLV